MMRLLTSTELEKLAESNKEMAQPLVTTKVFTVTGLSLNSIQDQKMAMIHIITRNHILREETTFYLE
jgi:hypothetical protein